MLVGDIMKSKEKRKAKVNIKITLKNIITFLAFTLSLFYVVIFYNYYFGRNHVYASESVMAKPVEEKIRISKAKEVNLEAIISQNGKEGLKEEYSVEETALEYITKYRNNASLPQGTIQVLQEGREGKQEITVKRSYQGEEMVAEEQIATKITKASVNKIVEIGTGNYKSEYKVKVGDTLFVTSDRLSVMAEPREDAQKVATLLRENSLRVLEIPIETWYKIVSGSMIRICKSGEYNIS